MADLKGLDTGHPAAHEKGLRAGTSSRDVEWLRAALDAAPLPGDLTLGDLLVHALAHTDLESRYANARELIARGADGTGSLPVRAPAGKYDGVGPLETLLTAVRRDPAQDAEIISALADRDLDPNRPGRLGNRPLHRLVGLGSRANDPLTPEVLAPLYDAVLALPGIDPTLTDDRGRTPIEATGADPRKDVIRARLEALAG